MSDRVVCLKITALFESNCHWEHKNVKEINEMLDDNNEIDNNEDDGYCSGEECNYENKMTVTYAKVPVEFEDFEMDVEMKDENFDWKMLLPKPTQSNGSGYCDKTENMYDLDVHETRYTIISVKKVTKYNN